MSNINIPEDVKERVLCAAIWYKDLPKHVHAPKNILTGMVLCGHNHAQIIGQHVTLLDKKLAQMGEYEQGFITNHNRFISREEAYNIFTGYSGKMLFSEDLNYYLASSEIESLRKEVERLSKYKIAGEALIEELYKTKRSVLKEVEISNEHKRLLLNNNGISSENYEFH